MTGPGAGTDRYVWSVSNNSPGNPKGGQQPFSVGTSGWYRFHHRFFDNAGLLAVEMSVDDPGGTEIFSAIRSGAVTDVIATVVGGNRYAWFSSNDFPFLAFDNAVITCGLLGSEDCNSNGIPDECELVPDCNSNGTPDDCELVPDCNSDGVPDACQLTPDCNANGIPDDCDIPPDCNTNGIPDDCEVPPDCNSNGVPDVCELVPDCNSDGIPDDCQLLPDCNTNGIPDDCELIPDCNTNGIPDACELVPDCNTNGIPDVCELVPDCNANGIPDACDIASGASIDCNSNGVPDDCDIAMGTSLDCQPNGIPDECDIASGASVDLNLNGVPDECKPDCNGNNIPDFIDILFGASLDCQPNGIPDECELTPDCNSNGIPDACELTPDCNSNGIPDDCETDCNTNGVPDDCDISSGTSMDTDTDGIPNECDFIYEGCNGDGGNQMGCTDCPCGNNATPGTIGGCINANTTSARLLVSGTPSVGMNSLRFEMTGGNVDTFGILVTGTTALPANMMNPCFADQSGVLSSVLNGLRCIGGPVIRHGTRATDSNGDIGVTTAGWGPPNGPPGGIIAQSGFTLGEVRHFQVFYRDVAFALCTQDQNTTQRVTVTITN